jgi:2-keto-4-pentenoate hydratase/2-oxohepta-3-ene-1,7-dioic acid hydratase in catechol pathway
MKWVRFEYNGSAQFGMLQDSGVIAATSLTWQGILTRQPPSIKAEFSPEQVRLLPPVERPGKIVAIGLNYMDHCRETNTEPPKNPVIFTKFPTAIIGPGAAITWSAGLTQQVDYEAELAVVIGRTARRVPEAEALRYVFGYTAANDVSARDLQFGDGQWVRGKSLDTFCPIGPALVTSDEIPDPQTLAIRCVLNGEVVQDSHTREMIFGVAHLVSFCSQAFTLEPGDIILTGTPHGTGAFRTPKLFMKDGDSVVIEIERIGRLENTCVVSGE